MLWEWKISRMKGLGSWFDEHEETCVMLILPSASLGGFGKGNVVHEGMCMVEFSIRCIVGLKVGALVGGQARL